MGSATLEGADSSTRGGGWGHGTVSGVVHGQVRHAVHRRASPCTTLCSRVALTYSCTCAGVQHSRPSCTHAHAAVQQVLCLAQIEAREVEGLGHDGGAAVVGA